MTNDYEQSDYKPFTPKPKEEKVGYKKRQKKWQEQLENTDDDISHRRFNTTLHPNQVVNSFKKCVHSNEVSKDKLMTCYRVVLQKLLADPSLSESEFLSLYKVIQSRANLVYAERSRRLKQIR